MSKTVTLGKGPNDKELIQQIEQYCKEQHINFTEAVRRLCSDALQLKRIVK